MFTCVPIEGWFFHHKIPKEVRSLEDHAVIVWGNLTTVGVMPAAKYDFFLTSVTNILASYKRNGLVILIHCNRASDTGRTRVFKVWCAILSVLCFALVDLPVFHAW